MQVDLATFENCRKQPQHKSIYTAQKHVIDAYHSHHMSRGKIQSDLHIHPDPWKLGRDMLCFTWGGAEESKIKKMKQQIQV